VFSACTDPIPEIQIGTSRVSASASVIGTAGATAEAAETELSRPTPTQRPAAPAMTNAAIKIREVQRNTRLLLVALPSSSDPPSRNLKYGLLCIPPFASSIHALFL
jgi:hypothetical protein